MGSGGIGSPAHIIGEYFKLLTGTDLTHVPYRGAAPAVADLIGGQIQVAFTEFATSLGYVRAGNLRALAVTTSKRSELLPDVPTLSEFIPGFEASQWVGLVAPRGTSPTIIEKLNVEINAALGSLSMKARFADMGGIVRRVTDKIEVEGFEQGCVDGGSATGDEKSVTVCGCPYYRLGAEIPTGAWTVLNDKLLAKML